MINEGDRLDRILVCRGLASSRSRAQSMIESGLVTVNGMPVRKAGQWVRADSPVALIAPDHPWVSRGALKLLRALDHFKIDVRRRTALDIGASTGGFTEVLLDRGAQRVYAVDVGHGQLAPIVRLDRRVINLESTDARKLDRALIPEAPWIVTCDASFIGLKKVLPAALDLAAPDAWLIALIKPQFEVGPENVGKGGIVRKPGLAEAVCEDIRSWLETEQGWHVVDIIDSPITGGDGNREFLIAARKG